MPSDFGSSIVSTWIYSIYANYTPTDIIGITETPAGINYSTDRRAMPYTMPEDGKIRSVSIYHEGGSGDLLLAVYSDDNTLPDM